MNRLIAGLQVEVIRKSQNPALLSLGLPARTSFSWILLHLCRQEDDGGLEGVLDISERSRSESRLVNHSYRQVAWPLLEESWKERLILVCPTRDPFHPFPTVARRANHGPGGLLATGPGLNTRHTPFGISGAVHGSWPSDVAWRRAYLRTLHGFSKVFCYACEAWSSYLLLSKFLVRNGEACPRLPFDRRDDGSSRLCSP
jgi:hypothetical protein